MVKIIDKIRNRVNKIGKIPISATLIGRNHVNDRYQIYDGRVIPMDVNVKNLSVAELKAFPLVNDPFALSTGVIQYPSGIPAQQSFTTLWSYVKSSPEIISIFTAIIEDIISDGWKLEGGRNKKKAAEEFLQSNRFKEVMSSMLWDALATGNGYLYKTPQLGKKELKGIIDKLPLNIEYKAKFIDDLLKEKDINIKSKFVEVPSSTMRIIYDKNGQIKEYVQQVGVNKISFAPDEIIHFRYMKIDGKVYGFTPLSSLTAELDTLAYIKDYARYYFEKGGVPNWMFILEDESPDSPTTQSFRKTMQLYADVQNKWKSLIVTGKVDVKDINRLTKDMEFRELARYITQVLVMTWGVPSSRLSDMLSEKGTRGATVSTEGYYRKISAMQDLLEELINVNLLPAFEVQLKFNRTYKQDEVREVQIEKVKTDVAEQRLRLGLWDYETCAKYLNVPDDIQEKQKTLWDKIEKLMVKTPDIMLPTSSNRTGGSSQFNQGQMNKHQSLSNDPEKLAQDSDKQGAAVKKDN